MLLQDEKADLQSFLTVPLTTYTDDMATDGTYADHVAVEKSANILGGHHKSDRIW